MIDTAIASLVAYAERTGLIEPCERNWAVNTLLEALKLDSYTAPETPVSGDIDLAAVLGELMDDAHARGVLPEDSVVYRDLFDTMLMGRLTPRPAQVVEKFKTLYAQSPQKATDWYYQFSQDTNYIRRGPDCQGHEVGHPHRVRRPGHHHQPLQAGEGPQGHRRRPQPARLRLSPLPAVRRERGLRGPGQPPRPRKSPHRAHHHQQLPLVPAVLPLRLLQRALHLPQQRTHPHED